MTRSLPPRPERGLVYVDRPCPHCGDGHCGDAHREFYAAGPFALDGIAYHPPPYDEVRPMIEYAHHEQDMTALAYMQYRRRPTDPELAYWTRYGAWAIDLGRRGA